jgi:dihydroorotase
MDVAVKAGRIATVAAHIPSSDTARAVDVSGLYVTPGLVDIHVHAHVFLAPGTLYDDYASVIPDHTSFRTAVTAIVEAAGRSPVS